MSSSPLVSVVMPARNVADSIAHVVHGVLDQDFGDFELLIADDASTDDTPQIAADLASSDPRIRLFEGGGTGVAAARRLLHTRARGRYILNWDADDTCPPNRISVLLDAARQMREPFMVGSAIRVFVEGEYAKDVTYPLDDEEIRRRLARGYRRAVVCCAAVLASAELFVDVPIRNKFRYMSDWDQVLRMAEQTDAVFGNVDDLLYDYRLSAKSISFNHVRRAVGAVFLRECERRRLAGDEEPESLSAFPKHLALRPMSLARVSAELPAKLAQQYFYP